ncbi:MAG: hypothetical protein WBL93_07150 [Lutisporaceae bacterium]
MRIHAPFELSLHIFTSEFNNLGGSIMQNMPMCPMMMAQMPMQMHMPMCMHMPMMEQMKMPMTMPMAMQEMPYDDDDKDEEYFKSMHSDACHEMMPYVMGTLDRMEQKGNMLYEDRPKREMVDRMTDEAYNDLIRDMPDMADEMSEERIIRPRRFARDIIRVLLINELIGRRRRRRRRHWDNYGYDFNDDYYFQD